MSTLQNLTWVKTNQGGGLRGMSTELRKNSAKQQKFDGADETPIEA